MSKNNIFLLTILVSLILIVLADAVTAQTAVGGGQFTSSQFPNADYCTPSLPQENIGKAPSTNEKECRCYNFEASYTEWREMYCEGGGLVEERTVQDLITPNCIETVIFNEQDWIYDRRCNICPESIVIGNWYDVINLNGKWLQQQDIIAYKFNQNATECYEVQAVKLRWNEQSVGGAIGFEQLIPIAIVLVIFFVLLKKVKK